MSSPNDPPFNRTTCSCRECVACCKRQPGPLVLSDFARIRDFLGLTTQAAKMLFKRSKGSIIGTKDGRIMRIPTITPKHSATGRCIFLDEKDRCRIHSVAPYGCAYLDTHMSKEEADRRVIHAIKQHATPEYQKFREELT